MKIQIFSSFKAKKGPLVELEEEYIRKLRGYMQVELLELPKELPAGVILLDERGEEYASPEFAELLDSYISSGTNCIRFAIGEPEGWDATTRAGAGLLLSLSQMTFTSQWSRAILIEQLYRGISIQRGLPYHKV